MKKLFFSSAILVFSFIACKKAPPVEMKKSPVAKAGADMIVKLPVDSAVLNGSFSHDPDGRIESYLWKQVYGPSASELITPQTAQTVARRLQPGLYGFELTVRDNDGLLSRDTVAVTLQPSTAHLLVANAGPDQQIDLLSGRTTLDGSASKDSSGLPVYFEWWQLTGAPAQISNPHLDKPTVVFTTAGIYRFELKVANTNGAAFDTMQVTVKDVPDCTLSRTEVPAQLTHLHQFSFSQYNTARLLAVGNKLIIPVDVVDPIAGSYVFVYDVLMGTYTLKELDLPRTGGATVVAGNKVFFAGGFTNFTDDERPGVTDEVDIYDAASNTWAKAKLSEARGAVKAGTAGNKVVFAGGLKSTVLSNRADVYDLQTGQWTTSVMAGPPRAVERVVADGANIYFLGGYTAWDNPTGFGFTLTVAGKAIDIYNVSSGAWSTNNMQVERYGFSAVLANDKILIAGGVAGVWPNERITSNVEVITLPTMAHTNTCLANATVWYSPEATAMKNGSVIFYLGQGLEKQKFNIYNPQTGAWSLGVHHSDVLGQHESAALASLNNQVYVLKGNSLFKLEY